MMSLASGDVVWAPYPYVGTNRMRPRPALIIASDFGSNGDLCWALMITNAARPGWPGDLPIIDHESYRLPIPSKIRTEKIATLATSRANLLDAITFAPVRKMIAGHLG